MREEAVMNMSAAMKNKISSNVDELMAKYDKGSRYRVLSGAQGKIVSALLFFVSQYSSFIME